MCLFAMICVSRQTEQDQDWVQQVAQTDIDGDEDYKGAQTSPFNILPQSETFLARISVAVQTLRKTVRRSPWLTFLTLHFLVCNAPRAKTSTWKSGQYNTEHRLPLLDVCRVFT